jgi:hypothetical protein
MPDWDALVSERLGTLHLTPQQRGEVVAELACHLEDIYKEQCAQGRSESEAIANAIHQVADWRELARKISLAKRGEESMINRAKSVWLPGIFTVTVSIGWLELLQRASFDSFKPWFQTSFPMLPFLLWVITLPLLGALGAFLSRFLAVESRARLAAGLFPPIAMFGVFLLPRIWAAIFERNGLVIRHPLHFAFDVFLWSTLPALALLLGAMPFLRTPKSQEA